MPIQARPIRVFTCALLASATLVSASSAQVRVSPSSVNVSSQGASTVFLSYGGVRTDQTAKEAVWCASVIPAAPDRGFKCNPATLWGRLPSRYDRSRASGVSGFTDIMSIPPSIARRAYGAANKGGESSFFYVLRFASAIGLPDEYVAVLCRLAGGGANVPLALTDVVLKFATETPVRFVRRGDAPPALSAQITYTGTGRLVGRWEIVRPGDDLPVEQDLLTESTLPAELRGTQRRYAQLARFNVFLPPTGRVTLVGPDPSRLPADVDGSYQVLLRIETSDDGAGDSDLSAVGSGNGIVHTGAVAGFPLPTLRYVVGAGESSLSASSRMSAPMLLRPRSDSVLERAAPLAFTWTGSDRAAFYRLEIERPDGVKVHSAIIPRGVGRYRAPPFVAERADGPSVRWRVIALDSSGRQREPSDWRRLTIGAPSGRR